MSLLKKLIAAFMVIGSTGLFAASKDFRSITLKDLNGKEYSFKDVGKPQYVKFWASWCPVCLEGLEEINNLSKEDNNFEVVTVVTPGINGEKNVEDFKEWFNSLGYDNVRVLLDTDGEAAKLIRLRAFPTGVFLDKDGKTTKIIPGHLNNDMIKSFFPKIAATEVRAGATKSQKLVKTAKDIEEEKKASANAGEQPKEAPKSAELRDIYLAGGCFWGVEAFMEKIYGVVNADSGYANGKTDNPKYEDVVYRNTGHAETVHVTYDPSKVNLGTLLKYYFKIIDPTSLNKQGNDRGTQYRTGIYYVNSEDVPVIETEIKEQQRKYRSPIVVEVMPLKRFDKAE